MTSMPNRLASTKSIVDSGSRLHAALPDESVVSAPSQQQLQQQSQQQPPQPQQLLLQQQQHFRQSQLPGASGREKPEQAEPLQWSRMLISMASIGIAACFLTSGIVQIAFAQFGISLCGVNFGRDDPSDDVTWLVASCWLVGVMRFLLSICIGRPPFNRSVWSTASKHRGFLDQMAALTFLPDVRPRSRDMSVLDREQLAAGIIHPAFYHRTLLVAWQEGLLITLWLMLHLLRLFKLSSRFSEDKIARLADRDTQLDELFAAIGTNSTSAPLTALTELLSLANVTATVNMLKSSDTVYKLASHTCELLATNAAQLFYFEDCLLLGLLGLTLLLLPMLSRMLRFFYNR